MILNTKAVCDYKTVT